MRPHREGRKLHLCGRLRSLGRSPWALLMSQATRSSDPARHSLSPNPVSQFPFQHSSRRSQPSAHTQHMRARTRKTLEACFGCWMSLSCSAAFCGLLESLQDAEEVSETTKSQGYTTERLVSTDKYHGLLNSTLKTAPDFNHTAN